jgi:hypothetical protein
MWHTDSSFKRVPDDMTRELEGRVAVHSFVYSRGLLGSP